MDFTNGEFYQNIERVDTLVGAALFFESEDDDNANSSDNAAASDILRAAVVFLHSALEEVIRNLFQHRLPYVNPENLNKIPFHDHEPSHRPKGILLGELQRYSGVYIKNIIFHSINNYVDTLNINSSTHLVQCLQLAEVDHEQFVDFYPSLDSLMKRRHQIVHQMDRSNTLDPLDAPVNKIKQEMVANWRVAVTGFAEILIQTIPSNSEIS